MPISRAVRLKTQFAGTVFGPRSINLNPQEEVAAEYNFITNTAGELRAEVIPHDGLPGDDIATLRLPKGGTLHVAVYTRREDPCVRC